MKFITIFKGLTKSINLIFFIFWLLCLNSLSASHFDAIEKRILLNDSVIEEKIFVDTPSWDGKYSLSVVFGASSYHGDYKSLYFVLPSVIDLSVGIRGEYHPTKRITLRLGFNKTAVSSFSSSPLYRFSGNSFPAKLDYNVIPREASGNAYMSTWGFKTNLNIMDFDYVYLLKQKRIGINKTLNHSVSGGTGFLTYNPMREIGWKTNEWVELRPLKTGDRMYGSLAMLFSTGYQIEYRTGNWRFAGEIKYAMTTTDYLDDYKSGDSYYGGDVDNWYQNSPEPATANGIKPISNIMRNTQKALMMDGIKSTDKKTGFLPDGYAQMHFGVNYLINNVTKIPKKIEFIW